MPVELASAALSALVDVVADFGFGAARDSGQEDPEKRRARVLMAADLWVLAALHDHQITEAEEQALATELAGVLKDEVELDVPALLERWKGKRAELDDDDFETKVQALANFLPAEDRPQVLAGVEAILSGDQSDALAIFRKALDR